MVTSPPVFAPVAPPPGPSSNLVADLPPPGSPDRWPWLQRLRRQPSLPLEPWLRALEGGELAPQQDLMAVLADHLDGPAMARLLRWWSRSDPWDPALPALIVARPDPCGREALLQACSRLMLAYLSRVCVGICPAAAPWPDRAALKSLRKNRPNRRVSSTSARWIG